jgi:hypothetical protein
VHTTPTSRFEAAYAPVPRPSELRASRSERRRLHSTEAPARGSGPRRDGVTYSRDAPAARDTNDGRSFHEPQRPRRDPDYPAPGLRLEDGVQRMAAAGGGGYIGGVHRQEPSGGGYKNGVRREESSGGGPERGDPLGNAARRDGESCHGPVRATHEAERVRVRAFPLSVFSCSCCCIFVVCGAWLSVKNVRAGRRLSTMSSVECTAI